MIEVNWEMAMAEFWNDISNLIIALGFIGGLTFVSVFVYLYLKDWWDRSRI